MANKFYPKGAEKVLSGAIKFDADTIAVGLVSNAYTFSVDHEFLSSLGSLVGTPQELVGKTIAGGVLDADDVQFGALAPGSTVKALAIFKDTGNPSTSPLLCYLDEVIGFPFATNGGEVAIPWSDGPAKILSLV